MAFKAINDSAGPNGLVPTLLVFGAYPRMIDSDAPSPTVTQRAAAIRKAMAEVQKLRAERQIADALNMRNGPRTNAVHELPPNSPVLVWREGNTGQSGYWDGPFTLLTVEGETCTVKLNSGPTTFRSTVVKPYLQSEPDEDEHTNEQTDYHPTPENQNTTTPEKAAQPAKRGRGRPRKYSQLETAADVTIYLQDDNQFKTSRQKELTGLLEKGVFEIV
jgi:AT hook motif